MPRASGFRDLAAPVGLAAVAGAANAAACWLQWPAAVPDSGDVFRWHLVPAGAAHGAVLAALALVGHRVLRGAPFAVRWLAGPIVGWLAGYLSWIPIAASIGAEHGPLGLVGWPFDGVQQALLAPFQGFGLVAALYYWSRLLREHNPGPAWAAQLAGVASGALGSLWFWIEMETWYLSLLHGAVWGLLASQSAGTSRNHSSARDRSTLPPLSTTPTRLPTTSRTLQ
jgi:hypothetical protein